MRLTAVVSHCCLRLTLTTLFLSAASWILPPSAFGQNPCYPPPNINFSCQMPIKVTGSGGSSTWSLPSSLKSVWVWAASSSAPGNTLTWNRSDGDKSFQMRFSTSACFQGGSTTFSAPANGTGAATTSPSIVIQDAYSTQDCSYQMSVNGQQYDPHVIIIGPPPNQNYCKKLTGDAQRYCILYFKKIKSMK